MRPSQDPPTEHLAVKPTLHARAGSHAGVLSWRWPVPVAALSSAPVGGGFLTTEWVLNVGVPKTYGRTDLAEHSREIADSMDLKGDGITLFTAADVTKGQTALVGSVTVDATIGISKPTWAADPEGGWNPWRPGTINLVVQVNCPLEAGAAVNAVATATEAKTQAMFEAGAPGTGTASDAVVVTWPVASTAPTERFAGPRSPIGSELAQAVHAAVYAGIVSWQGDTTPRDETDQ